MADPAELIMRHRLAVANYECFPTVENGTMLHATEKALLAALAKTAPEGWRLVPETPTEEMITAMRSVVVDAVNNGTMTKGAAINDWQTKNRMRWTAAIAAAPKVPT